MSHQVDVADWFFGSHPVSVMGVGGIGYWKDGRDIYDIQLVFEYPGGQKLQYSSVTTVATLPVAAFPATAAAKRS
ncbi:MAG: hypothetical protein R2724_12960 [Bryobacterales bacterium]